MFKGKVEICGVNTADLPVLKEAEKTRLLLLVKAGDESAREELIGGNLRLVLSVIQRFSNRGENMDDLFQIGCVGLIKAIDNFDLSHNVRFSTYAVPMIIGELRRHLRDYTSVRVSRSTRDIAYKAMQAREQLQASLGREPKISEIAEATGIKESTVTMALESIVNPVSLYEPLYNDGADTLFIMDQMTNGEEETSWISNIQFKDTMQNLSEREKKIMELRFLAGKTQVEVAREIGISQAQVSRLEKNAMQRIKTNIS